MERSNQSTPGKLCLLAAGMGTRVTAYPGLHKALLPVANRAAISRVLNTYDREAEVVVAVGHLADQVEAFLRYMHPDRKFTFVRVENYADKGAGPGTSLLACGQHLREPFVFTSIDTLFQAPGGILSCSPDHNWMGSFPLQDDEDDSYCKMYFDNGDGLVTRIEKGPKGLAFTGAAGVFNWHIFWSELQQLRFDENGEAQVLPGLRALAERSEMKSMHCAAWQDTGNDAAYAKAKRSFAYDMVVEEKVDEAIYVDRYDRGRVVKYFRDPRIVKQRVRRAGILEGAVPKNVLQINDNMYGYPYVNGDMLTRASRSYPAFWEYCEKLFEHVPKRVIDSYAFRKDCEAMIKQKTYERAHTLLRSDAELDGITHVNGKYVPLLLQILDRVPWDDMLDLAIPYFFHGDLQPENVIVTRDDPPKFVLLDWRDGFGSSSTIGDVYYDLAKLHHAMLVNGEIVRRREFTVEIHELNDLTATVSIKQNKNLTLLMEGFTEFCVEQGYNWENIELMSALTLINIAPMHVGQYRQFLMLYGKLKLVEALGIDY